MSTLSTQSSHMGREVVQVKRAMRKGTSIPQRQENAFCSEAKLWPHKEPLLPGLIRKKFRSGSSVSPLGLSRNLGPQIHLMRGECRIPIQEIYPRGFINSLFPGSTFSGEDISADRLSPSEDRCRTE